LTRKEIKQYIRKNTSKQRPSIMYFGIYTIFEFIRFLKHCSFTQ